MSKYPHPDYRDAEYRRISPVGGNMTTIEIVHLFRGKRSGNWKGRKCFIAKCPAHDDRMASLSITEDKAGATFLHCFRGCTIDEILKAKGLRLGDLFPDDKPFIPVRTEPEDWKIEGPVWFDTPEAALDMALSCAKLLTIPESERDKVPIWDKNNGPTPDPDAVISGRWDPRPPDGYVTHPFMRTSVLQGQAQRAEVSWWRLRTWEQRSRRWQVMNRTQRDAALEKCWSHA